MENTLFGPQRVKAEKTEERLYIDPAELVTDSLGHSWSLTAFGRGAHIINPAKLDGPGHYLGTREGSTFTIRRDDSPGLFE